MKILYISRDFGLNNGTNRNILVHYEGLINIFNEKNVYTVDLVGGGCQNLTVKHLDFLAPKKKIEKIRRYMLGLPSELTQAIINKIITVLINENISLVFVDDSTLGPLEKKIKKRVPNVKIISFYHDIKAELYKIWLKEKGLRFLPNYLMAKKNEKETVIYSDINIVLNTREKEFFKKYYKKDPERIIPVGIKSPLSYDREYFDEKFHLLFIGTTYYPNVEGIKWFIENVFYKLSNNSVLDIIGRNMEKLKNDITGERINLIGTVDQVNEYYYMANVVIAPIFDGLGMKVKTAEALSFGKAFVGSRESLVGYYENCTELEKKYVFQCNNSEEFIEKIQFIQTNYKKKYHKIVRDFYEKYYSTQAVENQLRSIKEISEAI